MKTYRWLFWCVVVSGVCLLINIRQIIVSNLPWAMTIPLCVCMAVAVAMMANLYRIVAKEEAGKEELRQKMLLELRRCEMEMWNQIQEERSEAKVLRERENGFLIRQRDLILDYAAKQNLVHSGFPVVNISAAKILKLKADIDASEEMAAIKKFTGCVCDEKIINPECKVHGSFAKETAKP